MVGQALELGHQGAQPSGARRDVNAERRLDGAGEGKRIGDRAVAGNAPGKPRGLLDGCTAHQRFDALVGISETLLEPHHRFPIDSDTKVTGLYDASMERGKLDFMKAFVFRSEESVG